MQGYNATVFDSGIDNYNQRLLIGTPSTGTIRMEWHIARTGQVIPPNWSQAHFYPGVMGNQVFTLRYPVADAQNLIVKVAIEQGFEWLFLHEHDVLIPPDTLVRLNNYMRDGTIPVVSGLYYTRARPSEPMVYRGRGNSHYDDWELGDLVWCDGVPTGCLLIHASILKAMWEDAEPYTAYGQQIRKVFDIPSGLFLDPESEAYMTAAGTSDLNWCSDVMQGGYFAKTGWPDYQDKEYPFLIDTNIFCGHINPNGEQFPVATPWEQIWKFDRQKKQEEAASTNGGDLGVNVADGMVLGETLK
jgi:hypothetical protein